MFCICNAENTATFALCSKITGHPFDRGLALFNAGYAFLKMESFEKGVALVERAHIEDANIDHETGAAEVFLGKVMQLAWQFCDDLATKSGLSLDPTSNLVGRLNESERYRLFLITFRFQGRQPDYRGYLAKDGLERNLNSIGKLTEV